MNLIITYGIDRVLLSADCRERLIATEGWTRNSTIDIIDFIQRYAAKGITQVVCTDIVRDGALTGPSLDLYREILNKTSIALIASGGISCLKDITDLAAIGCHGVIIGKAIYEGYISLPQLRNLC